VKGREKLNILLVDDNLENLVVLEALLEDPDYNIIKTTSGNEALSLMLEHALPWCSSMSRCLK